MTESDDKFTNKIISYGASLLLHAAVIGVFMSLSGGSPAVESDEGEEDEVESVEIPVEKKTLEKSDEELKPPAGTTVEPVKATVAPVRPSVPPPVVRPTPVKVDSAEAEHPKVQPAKVRPPKPTVDESEDGAQEMPAFHVVRQGETLTKIAALYNTTPQKLAKLNGKSLNAMNKLWVNQKVKLRK